MRPFNIFRLQALDEKLLEHTREVISESLDVLRKHPVPDKFLAHKTQEPFPLENDLPLLAPEN
jgi:hypothetical protein